MSNKNDDLKNIIVVGGGSGGAVAARAISAKLDTSKYSLTLINSRPYHIIYPATVRMVVSEISDNGRIEEKAFVPFDKVFHNGKGTFLQAKVASIEKGADKGGHVVLTNGDRLAYEVLVLAPGSIWDGPISFPDDAAAVTECISKSRTDFKNAQDIVLVGGGAVGVELAAEITDIWPTKNVTLVQGDSAPLNKTYPDKVRNGLTSRLRSRGIKLVFNDYVDEIPSNPPADGAVRTRSGQSIKADLVVSTRGPRPNTAFITSSLGASTATDAGFLKIKKTFQLAEHADIFALGDVVDVVEQKQAAKASAHAVVVATNVLNYLAGKPLKNYGGSSEIIVVTTGKTGGVGFLGIAWGIMLGDWFAKMVKSKTLLLDQLRPNVGY